MRRGRAGALWLLCAAALVCASLPRAPTALAGPTASPSAAASGPASATGSIPSDTGPGGPSNAGPALTPPDQAWPGKTVDIFGTGWFPAPCEVFFYKPALQLEVPPTCGVTDTGVLSAVVILPTALAETSYDIEACQGCGEIAARTTFDTSDGLARFTTLVVGPVPPPSSPPSTPPSTPARSAVTATVTSTASVVVITPSTSVASPSRAGTVRVPDVVGDRLSDARHALARAGLALGFVRPAGGTVVQEIPVAGSLVAPHSLVVVSFAVPAAASATTFPYWLLAAVLAVLLSLGGAAASRALRWRTRTPAAAAPAISVRVVASSADRTTCALHRDGPVFRLDLRPVPGRATTEFRVLGRRT